MKVLAAILTHHPGLAALQENIAAVRPQVDAVLIVDNASAEIAALRALAHELGCTLLENATNLGVAAALNQAVLFARSQAVEAVLFLDQDSCVSVDFVQRSLDACHRAAVKSRVGLVTPTIVTRFDGARHGPVRLRNGAIPVAQTSGALMPLGVFDAVGLFRTEMFIDYVDYEHCLRLVSGGWKIVAAPDAVLHHSPGNSVMQRVLGLWVKTVNAAHQRHYYETRNCLWTVRTHFRRHPEMTVRLLLRMMYVRAQALLFERDRAVKVRAIALGCTDAVRNRLGPCPF